MSGNPAGRGFYPDVPSETGGEQQQAPAPHPGIAPDAIVPENLPDQHQDPAVYATGKGGRPGGAQGSGWPAGPGGYGGPPYYPAQGYGPGQGYPPAAGMPAPYPPDQGPGMHVMGYPALIEDPAFPPEKRARERSGVFLGSIFLCLGLCFPPLWIAGASLPCCYPRSRRVRTLALINALTFIAVTLIVVLVPVFVVGMHNHNMMGDCNGRC